MTLTSAISGGNWIYEIVCWPLESRKNDSNLKLQKILSLCWAIRCLLICGNIFNCELMNDVWVILFLLLAFHLICCSDELSPSEPQSWELMILNFLLNICGPNMHENAFGNCENDECITFHFTWWWKLTVGFCVWQNIMRDEKWEFYST